MSDLKSGQADASGPDTGEITAGNRPSTASPPKSPQSVAAQPTEMPSDARGDGDSAEDPILQVYSVGPTTVVGFGGRDVLDNVNLALCRSEVLGLIKENEATAIAFDLTGVLLMPSGLLGLLASLRQEGVEVHIYNPSADVREVLEVTHLDKVMQVREVDVPVESAV